MTIQEMSLPQDLPWKRLAASIDMMDQSIDDPTLPPRWQSSIAIFYADGAETDAYCDRIITYVKVVCTITGFQVGTQELGYDFVPPASVPAEVNNTVTLHIQDLVGATLAKAGKRHVIRKMFELQPNQVIVSKPEEIAASVKVVSGKLRLPPAIQVREGRIYLEMEPEPGAFASTISYEVSSSDDAWGSKAVDNYTATVEAYRPCHGAMLQVSLYPGKADGVAIDDYPYIVAFEPKKRELYETATESGEQLSGSTSNVNVRKGTTTTNQSENSDVLTGWNASAQASYAGTGGGASFGTTGEWGSRQRYGTESVNITTTDTSREKRESIAHSTSISQLYTLLQSYHLATNRSLFLMLPRPHQKQQFFTFANGLRELEGIQEFFFVTSRPKTVPGLCVAALLETAHVIDEERSRTIGRERYGRLDPPMTQDFDKRYSGNGWAEFPIVVNLPEGYKLDRSRGEQGIAYSWSDHSYENFRSTVEFSRGDRSVTVTLRMYDNGNESDPTRVHGWITVYGITDAPIETPTEEFWIESDLVITGRRLVGCVAETALPDPAADETDHSWTAESSGTSGVTATPADALNSNDRSGSQSRDESASLGADSDDSGGSSASDSGASHVARKAERIRGRDTASPLRSRNRPPAGRRESLGERVSDGKRDTLGADRWLTYETSVPVAVDSIADSVIGNRMRLSNLMIRRIGQAMIQSVGSERRTPLGKRRIADAGYIAKSLARALAALPESHPQNVVITKLQFSKTTQDFLRKARVKNVAQLAAQFRFLERSAESPVVRDELRHAILTLSGLKRR